MKIFRSHLQSLKEQRVAVDYVSNKELGDVMLMISCGSIAATHYMTRDAARELAEYILTLASGDEKA